MSGRRRAPSPRARPARSCGRKRAETVNDYSLAIVVGRLTRDPELKYTNPGGVPFLRMTIAVNRQVKGAEPPRKTISMVDVTTWRHLAELCAQFLKKGRAVMVVGSLRQSRWVDNAGKSRARLEVTAERIQFLGTPGTCPPDSGTLQDPERAEVIAKEAQDEDAPAQEE